MLERGRVVRALSGRDSGRCFAVVKVCDDGLVLICDGKSRKLEKPKLKKVKHLEPVDRYVPEESMITNRLLRRALHEFNYTQFGERRDRMLTKGVSK